MESGPGPALAHRSVASIRSLPNQSQSGPLTPHTPPRGISSTYGSPATIRADDDFILIEIGSRYVRVGFAGDTLPKARLGCGPDDQRRVGDFRKWQGHKSTTEKSWTDDHEIWRYDMRTLDLGLFRDRLERMLRDAFSRFLLIDSRPRRTGLILDSAVPVPLLSAVMDTLFGNFQTPMISLMSSAAMTVVAAGVRSALVINLGWAEATVTTVYEYREVKCTRSVRGGKYLLNTLYKVLHKYLTDAEEKEDEPRIISFSECEDIMCRLLWCRPSDFKVTRRPSAQLDTVVEQDESEENSQSRGTATIPLRSTIPPTTLEMSFEKLADVCDDALFDTSALPSTFDDHELPLHLLIYQHLLQVPIDARAVCMSRIIFEGGCSQILGVKERVVHELTSLVDKRGWTPVSGKGVDQLRNKMQLNRYSNVSKASDNSISGSESSEDLSLSSRPSSIATQAELDAIEAKLARNRNTVPQVQGQIRVLHSLGAWSGASLLCQLKIPALATIDRELWQQQGANGASRPGEVDVKAQSRQSMGAGGLIRGSGGHHTNWTLGAWGTS